ncbi:hypothetical protein CEXT_661511 [Caerostris extrusa]|uniref:Uncharacterized protein n=1 Tax=Caerostris extrusa TaxID=172846 RepID=A0AAV4PRG2_CAEEX|nr:hypothetical protein CEXT_661511 [Caerostris extrusa]
MAPGFCRQLSLPPVNPWSGLGLKGAQSVTSLRLEDFNFRSSDMFGVRGSTFVEKVAPAILGLLIEEWGGGDGEVRKFLRAEIPLLLCWGPILWSMANQRLPREGLVKYTT